MNECIEAGWKLLAARVLSLALTDLASIGDFTHEKKEKVQDDAAWFFALGMHEPYCILCDIRSDVVRARAIQVARVIKKRSEFSE